MPYPTKYTRQYGFQGYQDANPSRPLPGDKVDADFNTVALSSDEVVEFLKLHARSDGLLKNGVVTVDSLSMEVAARLGFDESEDWSADATLVTATGSDTPRTLADWMASFDGAFVSVKDPRFAATGNGEWDDTAAIQAAIDSLGAAGGRVLIPNSMRCLIDGDLTVKSNVSLVGPHSIVGSPNNNTDAPYGSVGGALLVNSSKTITLEGGASLRGLLIHRKGMTFPASNSSAFAGTAVTAGGDDVAVLDCMILGFNQAILSSGYQRGRFFNLWLDNLSGISIADCYDIVRIENVHCWPFAVIEQHAIDLLPTQLQRSGTAFALTGVADWAKLTNCFAYGYLRGFDINNVNTPTLVSCTADGTAPPNTYAGSRGFSIRGTTNHAKIIGCQAASQEIGFYLDTGANIQNQLTDCIAWNGTNHGFFIGSGDWVLKGGGVRQYTNGVLINNSASRVLLDGFQFGTTLSQRIIFNASSTTGDVRIGSFQDSTIAAGGTIVSGTYTAATVASASALNLPVSGSDFNITGTTNIATILTGWAGREINLYFSGVLTVTNGTGSSSAIRLSGATDFTTAAGAALKLRHNGTQWYEVGRAGA